MDFRPIRNKIGSFSFDSLTRQLLAILRNQETGAAYTAFWHPLILLKWTLEFSEQKYPHKIATRADVIKLLRQLEDLEMSHEIFDLKRNGRTSKTFTILACQQFMYQEQGWRDSFARQLILFKKLKHKYDIASSFEEKSGLDIEDFLKMLYIIWLCIFHTDIIKISYYGYISPEVLGIIETTFGKKKLEMLLSLFSISRENLKEVLLYDKRGIKNYNLQSFESSIFTRKPFFLFDRKYFVPHKDVLNHTINYFIYEFMKSKDDSFTTELGMRMEKYMKLGLDEIGVKYLTENDLKKTIGLNNNLVDFVIDKNVLVEAKAIEMKPYVSVNPEDDILANEFRKNLVKAYSDQMLNVAEKLNNNQEYFGIIVTYRKLFLGDSSDIWAQFLKDETIKLRNEESLKILPIENLFFIDLYTWDLLIQLLKRKTVSLIDILKKARENDSDPKTKKFSFSMHLAEYNIGNFDCKYLEDAYEEVSNCLEESGND